MSQSDFASQLWDLFERHHEFRMETGPEFATYEGDFRFNAKLSDVSEEGLNAENEQRITFLKELNAIPRDQLSEEDQLNHEMFELMLEDEIEGHSFQFHRMPLNQMTGFHLSLPQLIDIQPLKKADDFGDYFTRLRGFDKQVDDVIANMKKGLETGLVSSKVVIEQTLPQMQKLKDVKAQDSVFFLPLAKADLSEDEKEKISAELSDVIENSVNPAYERLYQFTKNDYLPHCRETLGLWDLPNGEAAYRHQIKTYTVPDMSADEIHELGLQEVERIYQEKAKLKERVGFDGDVQAFNQHLRDSPEFFYESKEKMWEAYEACMATCYERITPLFHRLPEAPCELKEVEAYKSASSPQAYYYPAPEDGSRPGYYYINTYDLPSRPSYNMTALTLHEAVPGHHLQIALAAEQKHLPYFRRRMIVTAYVEGWGLYSEYLGHDMQMYDDPYQLYGALSFEMWRACRLVVDTGLHHKKWTREQCVDFMKQRMANSEMDIRSEVDRYSILPGQALSYKIGEIKIRELRAKAEKHLGDKFDIRDFHQVVLDHGALPLAILEEKVDEWLAHA